VIGLLQHLQFLPFTLPVISVPGATFGNRNMGGEAVAMAIPFMLAVLASGRGWWRGSGDASGEGARAMRPLFAAGLLLAALLYLAATRARGAWIGGVAGVTAFVIV